MLTHWKSVICALIGTHLHEVKNKIMTYNSITTFNFAPSRLRSDRVQLHNEDTTLLHWNLVLSRFSQNCTCNIFAFTQRYANLYDNSPGIYWSDCLRYLSTLCWQAGDFRTLGSYRAQNGMWHIGITLVTPSMLWTCSRIAPIFWTL